MASIKARLKRLEKRTQRPVLYPCVVELAENESLEDAMARALAVLPFKPDGQFIVAPTPLTPEQWQLKYSPEADLDLN
jgi:hypothetical protein